MERAFMVVRVVGLRETHFASALPTLPANQPETRENQPFPSLRINPEGAYGFPDGWKFDSRFTPKQRPTAQGPVFPFNLRGYLPGLIDDLVKLPRDGVSAIRGGSLGMTEGGIASALIGWVAVSWQSSRVRGYIPNPCR